MHIFILIQNLFLSVILYPKCLYRFVVSYSLIFKVQFSIDKISFRVLFLSKKYTFCITFPTIKKFKSNLLRLKYLFDYFFVRKIDFLYLFIYFIYLNSNFVEIVEISFLELLMSEVNLSLENNFLSGTKKTNWIICFF